MTTTTTTYEEWLEEYEDSYQLTTYDTLGQYIGYVGLGLVVDELALEDGTVNILNKRLQSNGDFSWSDSSSAGIANRAMVEALITAYPDYADMLETLKDCLEAECFVRTYPNSGKSLLQYNQANGIYTAITKDWSSSIKIEVSGCDERCTAAVYGYSDNYDEAQNLGRPATGTTKFVFNLSGKSEFSTIEIRIPFEGVTEVN